MRPPVTRRRPAHTRRGPGNLLLVAGSGARARTGAGHGKLQLDSLLISSLTVACSYSITPMYRTVLHFVLQ